MIDAKKFIDLLVENKVDFFSGVPDSLLKDMCAYITDAVPSSKHIIAANEGGAIALASGYNLATGKIPLVYLQNSGLGNCINPLLSLADAEVYRIPVLIVIGWRGEPRVKDEPQHIKQGRVMIDMLKSMEIPFEILPEDFDEAKGAINSLIQKCKEKQSPHVLIVRKGTFEPYQLKNILVTNYELSREEAVKAVINTLDETDIVVSTTGMTSREVFEYRREIRQSHDRDFLTIGSMGHSNQIALSIALAKPCQTVYCFDGDASLIMHLGSMGIIGEQSPKNFRHILFNNGAHDSVGGQPTIGFQTDFGAIAKSLNYKHQLFTDSLESLSKGAEKLKTLDGPSLMEIRVNKGARKDLGRPDISPQANKESFQQFLNK